MEDYENDPGWQYLRQSYEQMIADQSKPYDSKKNVWIPDAEEGYIAAEIQGTKGNMITVNTVKGNEVTIKKDFIQEMNPPKFEKVEDMSSLTFLNDASVLYNLRSRYHSMLIYTYSGLFCVVINPYKRLPIYTDSVAHMYMGKRRTEMPPHLFAVSDEAYRNMLIDHENQSMLITGESGAGKTENTKKVIAYFAAVGASQQEKSGEALGETGKKKITLEDQIVQTNPVLEAFGNARTVRNNNSSRFGKFIRIHFSKQGKVASCDIEHYLLEKSRVIRQAPGERCYHIFYQLYSDHLPNLKKDLLLDKPLKDYYFVAQAELTIDGVNDKEEHQLTDDAFDILHFSPAEKLNCYKSVAAIMHMGNMKFKQRPREEQAEPDGTDEAEKASSMLGVNHEEFLKALTRPRVKVGTEWVAKGQNLEQVNWAVGAMAKGLYSRIFNWLVKKCNGTLDQKGIPRDYFIGVLDIAGFEIFDFNSFEQLWINFVNERLQQFFNHHMFVLEQEEYARENIQWTFIDFGLDLEACIELIEKPMGIISILDEECIVPKATDQTLAQKLIDQHLGKHPNFEKPKPPKGKQGEAHFAMRHYAGTVRYNVTNWLEKNKDPLNDTCVGVMKGSKGNDLLVEVWKDYTTQEEAAAATKDGGARKKGKSGSFLTVSMLYRESLNNLMHMLNMTHPHFIRCIIPNEKKTSGLIEASLVLNQLTCNGVLEGIRICRKGFPNRQLHGDFKQRYSLLAVEESKSSTDVKKCAEAILGKLIKDGVVTEDNFRIGETKVFFRAGVLAHLEDVRDEALRVVITNFQAFIRSYLGTVDKKRKEEQRFGLLILQRNIRAWCSLRQWDWFKLYTKVRPMLREGKVAEEMEKLTQQIATLEENLKKEADAGAKLRSEQERINNEKASLVTELASIKTKIEEIDSRLLAENASKIETDRSLQELNDRLTGTEDSYNNLMKEKKSAESEADMMRKRIADLEISARKADAERQSKEHQSRSLEEEMQQQAEVLKKLNKEINHQQEVNKKLVQEIQDEEDKTNHINKVKGKLDQALLDLEERLEHERRAKSDALKAKRKVEGEVRIVNENSEEVMRQKHDLESNLKRKEGEVAILSSRLEDEQSLANKLQRQIKDLQSRMAEMEEEVESVRESRAKTDRAKSDLQCELEELQERLEEQGGATESQIELNKKREAEVAKLKRYMEEAHLSYEQQIIALKKKHSDAVAELKDQYNQIEKQRQKIEKEKSKCLHEIEELSSQLNSECVAKSSSEKIVKQLEDQLNHFQIKMEEQGRELEDFLLVRNRLVNENSDLTRQLEEQNEQLSVLQHVKTQLGNQLEDAKRMLDEEVRNRHSLSARVKNLQIETEQAQTNLEEEIESKNEAARQLGKANIEIQQLQSKFEGDGLIRVDEIEEMRRKQGVKITELQEALEAANQKIVALDKVRARLVGELDDAQMDTERAKNYALHLEKKESSMEVIIEEWRRKSEELSSELETTQRDVRNLSTDFFKAKTSKDEMQETVEALRRDNKSLSGEIKDLTDQLSDGGRSQHEMQKNIRRLEVEKEELQRSLDEAENALEAEESKVTRAQIEVDQIKSEIEKRIQEKEEEFESTRNNHQKALESIQASLEVESRSKAELLRVKKLLESEINELEITLDHANKANVDAQKNLRACNEQIRELQIQIEDEQRERDELREQYFNAEKRFKLLETEKDEIVTMFEQIEKSRRSAEAEATETRETANKLVVQTSSLSAIKRKTEGEIQAIHTDMEEALRELRASEDRCKKATADTIRIADELRQEHEHSMHVDRLHKNLEQQVKDLQTQLDESEQNAIKGGKKVISRLEERVKILEIEVDSEQRKCQEVNKTVSKVERRVRELQFQADEDKKSFERMQDLIEKLQDKIKVQKRQLDQAEELATKNLQKYRQTQYQLDDALERADSAETTVSRLRVKTRVNTIQVSRSSTALMTYSQSHNRLANSLLE